MCQGDTELAFRSVGHGLAARGPFGVGSGETRRCLGRGLGSARAVEPSSPGLRGPAEPAQTQALALGERQCFSSMG